MTTFAEAKKLGLCQQCRHKQPIPGKSRCEECKNKGKINYEKKSKSLEWREKNSARVSIWQKNNREKKNLKESKHKLNLKNQVFDHYGRFCECCGESQVKFLTIDHTNGEGTKHRKILKEAIYRWLIKQEFPDEFQVLCFNCNCAKGIYGVCPHQKEKCL